MLLLELTPKTFLLLLLLHNSVKYLITNSSERKKAKRIRAQKVHTLLVMSRHKLTLSRDTRDLQPKTRGGLSLSPPHCEQKKGKATKILYPYLPMRNSLIPPKSKMSWALLDLGGNQGRGEHGSL